MNWRRFTLFTTGFAIGFLLFLIVSHQLFNLKAAPNHNTNKDKRLEPIFSTFDESLAQNLFQEVTIVCLVMTYSVNHRTRADNLINTWGKRCNKLIIVSNATDAVLKTIVFSATEGREFLWEKTKNSLSFVFEHHLKDGDWFLKTDDDL